VADAGAFFVVAVADAGAFFVVAAAAFFADAFALAARGVAVLAA
jgi:hypothetical protein